MVAADYLLTWVDRPSGIVAVIEIASQPTRGGIEAVIRLGIIGVIARLVGFAVEIGTGIGQVPIADLALDRQPRLDEAVAAEFGEEMLDLEVADLGIKAV